MKVLLTGSKGFIGSHMGRLLSRTGHEVIPFELGNSLEELEESISKADFIIHLAGVNRPKTNEEYYSGNYELTKTIVDLVKRSGRQVPIIFSSSTQASLDNDYGLSKKKAEDYLLSSPLPIYIYRLANVFGSGCKPNYNSVVATFCYNIAHSLPIEISDKNKVIRYNYVEDVCEEFLKVVNSENKSGFVGILDVKPLFSCSLGKLAELLYFFKQEVESPRHLPTINGEFELDLFKAMLSYMKDESYNYNYACDERGSFEELYKSPLYGQISENVAYPGIIKGVHYHTRKKEIFYPIIGHSIIIQRSIEDDSLLVEEVNEDNLKMVDIIPLYTHEIKNVGSKNSRTIMWVSEPYDPSNPDTIREEVEK